MSGGASEQQFMEDNYKLQLQWLFSFAGRFVTALAEVYSIICLNRILMETRRLYKASVELYGSLKDRISIRVFSPNPLP